MRRGAVTDDAGLRGLWGFPLTPFDRDGAVDWGALRQGVSFQVEGGADVVVGVGIIAEVASLTFEEWAAAVEAVVDEVARRVPVLVSIPAWPGHARRGARAAARLRADGLLVLPPERADAGDLGRYLTELSDISGLGLVVYQSGPLFLEPAELERLAGLDCLIGLKDGQRDFRRFRRLRNAVGDRLLFIAAWEDLVLPYWALGAKAFCPASMAHDPSYARRWYACLQRGDVPAAGQLLQLAGYPLTDLRLSRPGIDVAVVKAAMSERGLTGGWVRPPKRELADAERSAVQAILTGLDIATLRGVRTRLSGGRTNSPPEGREASP